MSTRARGLPPQFASLEPFVEQWAVAGSDARMHRRLASTPEQRDAFRDAMLGALDDVLAHLDTLPLDDFGPEDECLMELVLALPHVALAVEQQRDLEPQHAHMQAAFVIERSSEQFGTPGPSGTV
ncbi:MAG: hypothetical protein U0W40_14135 [Acidimicrobiia bacterium]